MDGHLVKKIRHCAMLTQEELAREISVALRTVSRWETGGLTLGLKNQRKIVEFCKNHNIDIDKIKGE